MNTCTLPDKSILWRVASRCALVAGVLAAVAAPAAVRGAPPAPRTSTEFKRKQAERQRQFELKQRQFKTEQERASKQTAKDTSKRSSASKEDSSPPFNAHSARPPAEFLKSYVAAARSASSMEQLLRYLPDSEQKSLKEQQAQYDPKEAARARERHRKQSPDMKPESLEFLTNPPYTNELNHHRRIAAKILAILSIRIDGNKAVARVSTTGGATVNGVRYPYGTAQIELVGEGDSWKIGSYNDSNVAYLEPPTE